MATRIRRGSRAHLYIEEWMADRGLNDENLAGRLNVARQTVWKWRREQHRLDPSKIAQIAHALDIEPEDLWRTPNRPSVDALLADATDEMIQKAIEMVGILRRTGS